MSEVNLDKDTPARATRVTSKPADTWLKFARDWFAFTALLIACLVCLLTGHPDAALAFGFFTVWTRF